MHYFFLALILAAALVIGAAGLRGRVFKSTPVEVFADMDRQAKVGPQAAAAFFADGNGARPQVVGTLPMGFDVPAEPVADGAAMPDGFSLPDSYFNSGLFGEFYGDGLPEEITVDASLLARGKDRFGIYCAICHGESGDGNGVVAQFGTMRPVANLHEARFADASNPEFRPNGELFEIITKGRGRMSGYGSVLPASDRWAIIAHLRALQAAQAAGSAAPTEAVEPGAPPSEPQ